MYAQKQELSEVPHCVTMPCSAMMHLQVDIMLSRDLLQYAEVYSTLADEMTRLRRFRCSHRSGCLLEV